MTLYRSTRGAEHGLTASQAVLNGLAADGGLYVPETVPAFDFELKDLKGKSYKEIAGRVLRLWLSDYTDEEIAYAVDKAYSTFDCEEVAPMAYVDGAWYLELFHGQTIAFKDVALSILPYLMTMAARKNGVTDKIVILTATSGDTGKAAMAGFTDVPGTGIVVFYPEGGVSHIQELQMKTQPGANVDAVAIKGNFDDAQTGVKKIFGDKAFRDELKKKGIILSSANSINIGRLVPQIVYYVVSYIRLLEGGKIGDGEKINICVPTGNFGNILAAFLAKEMGLPVAKLICASNDNKVLYDFFRTGVYDRKREFILTSSPSMDILVSSNLERLIFLSCGCDADRTASLMKSLSESGSYEISDDMKAYIDGFCGGWASQDEVAARIGDVYKKTGYVLDTHTAVGSCVYGKYARETGDDTVSVIASTASPYKFAADVVSGMTGEKKTDDADDWEIIGRLHEMSGLKIPAAVAGLKDAPLLHTDVCTIEDMPAQVMKSVEAFA